MSRKSDQVITLGNELIRIAKDQNVSNEQFLDQANLLMARFFKTTKVKAPKKKVRRGVGSY
jgi:hypothetical protein